VLLICPGILLCVARPLSQTRCAQKSGQRHN
jgi:hypothetical protein